VTGQSGYWKDYIREVFPAFWRALESTDKLVIVVLILSGVGSLWFGSHAEHPSWQIALAIFLVSLFVLVLKMPYKLYVKQRATTQSLTERLAPKLSIEYDPTKPPCKSESAFHPGNFKAECFRLEVQNTSEDTIENCEGHLIAIHQINKSPELGAMRLTWADMPGPATSMRLIRGIPRHLDILYITEHGRINVCSQGWPINQQGMFDNPGEYIFRIVVSGDKTATPPPYSLKLTYTGNWKTSTMKHIN
jgi:hypothetical protein